tara:strand:+ start:7952 stop:9469 length:1518 start_codon:yes stop_codon:yes gene_type:complete
MSISLSKLNSSVSTITTRLPVIDLQNAGQEVSQQNAAKTFSVLGAEANQTVAGMIGLTQEVDEGYEADIIEGIGLVEMGDGVPSITPDIVGDPSGFSSDIDAITGSTGGSRGGLKFLFFGGSAVEAIAALISAATGKPPSQILSILQLLTSNDLKGTLQKALVSEISQTLAPVIAQFNQRFSQVMGGNITSILEDIVDIADGSVGNILQTLAGGKIPPQLLPTLVQAISDKNFSFVINEVARISPSTDISLIESTVLGQSTALPDRVQQIDPFLSLPNFDVGSASRSWAGSDTVITGPGVVTRQNTISTSSEYVFSAITSMEELEAELRSVTREITETVVHWTANYIDQDVGARETHSVGLARGFAGCSYHFVCRRDGTIERGRPLSLKGEHAGANGHDNFSVGFSFVAGYNCLSGTPNPNRYISSESITSAQWNSLDQYLEAFWKVFPGGQVFGHNDTDPGNKPDPGISMPQYITNKFGKRNVTVGTSSPLNTAQLALAIPSIT